MNAVTPIYVDEARYNLYATIHKGLRRAQTQLLVRLGALDAANDDEVRQIIADLRMMMTLGRQHLIDESIFIHEVIEAKRGGATSHLEDDHAEHERDFQALERMLDSLESMPSAERAALARQVYLRYSLFLAADFEHMLEEETTTLALLHELFDDGELAAIEGRIVGSIEPGLMMAFIRVMIPAMNPTERFGMLSGMKAAMPAPVFAAVVDAGVKPVLAETDYLWLQRTLSLAA